MTKTPQNGRPLAVELRDLERTFRAPQAIVRAVDGLSLAIGVGEIVALLGPNGAGKSTTIDMLLGFTEPSAGTVSVFGRPPAEAIAGGAVGVMLQTGGRAPGSQRPGAREHGGVAVSGAAGRR
jgi:ABC-2 type transport system ATP-binding protein